MKPWIICFCLGLSQYAIGHDFTAFKLGPDLEARRKIIFRTPQQNFTTKTLDQNSFSQNPMGAKSAFAPTRASKAALQASQKKLMDLVGQGMIAGTGLALSALTRGGNQGQSSDQEDAPLYTLLGNYLQGNFKIIGQDLTSSILHYNQNFNLGEQNYRGMVWQKPFGYFKIMVDRQLAPDLFNPQRWIVTDKFIITIDAQTFLNKLQSDGQITISDQQLRAFAGIGFQRAYTSFHYADSFKNGLVSDFSSLFLPFLKFGPKKIYNLNPYEIMSKQDALTVAAGGVATSPSYYGFSGSLGFLVSTSFLGKVTLQRIGPLDQAAPGEAVRLSLEKQKSVMAGATARINLDFLSLLRLTLLSFDFDYSLADSQVAHLKFMEQDKALLTGDTAEAKELKHLMSFQLGDLVTLKPFVVSNEQRRKETLNARYMALIWGGSKKSSTEQVSLIKDGKETIFYRSFAETVKTVQNVWSRLWSGIVGSIVGTPSEVKPQVQLYRGLTMEYDGTGLIRRSGEEYLPQAEKLSLNLSKEYYANNTSGKLHQARRRLMRDLVQPFPQLNGNIAAAIDSEQLKAPMTLQYQMRLLPPGILYFLSLEESKVFEKIARVCKSYRVGKWRDDSFRRKAIHRLQIFPSEVCVKTMGKEFLGWRDHWNSQKQLALKKLKQFLLSLHRESGHVNDFFDLFHEKNVFINGSFQAVARDGTAFQTFFSRGEFQGLGVIDWFERSVWDQNNPNRTPASITTN